MESLKLLQNLKGTDDVEEAKRLYYLALRYLNDNDNLKALEYHEKSLKIRL